MKNDGGPAFPVDKINAAIHDGMSLRDYFAAKAMAAWITSPTISQLQTTCIKTDLIPSQAISKMAYEIADAMLAAREK